MTHYWNKYRRQTETYAAHHKNLKSLCEEMLAHSAALYTHSNKYEKIYILGRQKRMFNKRWTQAPEEKQLNSSGSKDTVTVSTSVIVPSVVREEKTYCQGLFSKVV